MTYTPSHVVSRDIRARDAFRAALGLADESRRAREIAALPSKLWKGHLVYRIDCRGDFGKGPHEMWVPEGVLWSLIALDVFRCPYHA